MTGVEEPAAGTEEDKAIKQSIEEKLRRLNITTVADLLSLKCDGPIGLLRGAGLEQHEYEFLHGALMHERSNNLKSKSAMEVFLQQKQSILLENKKKFCTSGVFLPGLVTELSGPPFVGKSLITLDLTIRSIINALECPQDDRPIKALYVDIKKKLHSSDVSDIEDMTREILQRSQSRILEVADVLKCLEIVSINTFSELLKWIESDDFATLTAENCIVTIVIDSLSKFAVMDNKAHGLTDETELTPESLLQFGSHLNQVASILLCPVVISTSVRVGSFKSSSTSTDNAAVIDVWEGLFPMAPTLQYCVHVRLILLFSQYPDLTKGWDSNDSAARCLLLEKHPSLAQRPLLFDLGRLEELYDQCSYS